MSELELIAALVTAGGLILVLSLATCWLIARRRGLFGASLVLVLRLGLLGVLAVLVWRIFWQFNEVEVEQGDERRQRRLIILEDHSHSMDFKSGNSTRGAAAAGVCQRVERLAATHPAHPEVQRLWFAGNLVAPDQNEQLRRDSTQTAAALRRTFGLFQPQGVLIVSDGAATDGQPPQFILDWARNRGLAIYAVSTGGEETDAFDLVVMEVENERTNPKTVHAFVGSHGNRRRQLRVVLTVDGKETARKEVPAGERQEIAFPFPELAEGWHEYAVSIPVDENEVTPRNNIQRGIFQVVSPRKLLFIYDAPKLENRYLVQFLRELYERERVEVFAVTDPKLAELRLQDYLLAIIGDVNPSRLPPDLRDSIRQRETPSLVLSGRQLLHWQAPQLPNYPITEFVATRNFYTAQQPEGILRVSSRNTQSAFRQLQLDSLRINTVEAVTLSPRARSVFSVFSGDQEYPFLVADSLERPRQLALLCDTTWKWGLHPDPQVRSDYKAFWRAIMNWLVGGPGQDFELDLDFEPDPGGEERTVIRTRHPNPDSSRALRDVTFRIRQQNLQSSRSASPDGADWLLSWPHPIDRPAVVWFQAEARSGAREVRSLAKPLLLPMASQELVDTRAHPERLQALVQDPEQEFAPAGQEEALVKRLLARFETPDQRLSIRRRQPSQELIFAAIAVLLVALEWLIERTLKARQTI